MHFISKRCQTEPAEGGLVMCSSSAGRNLKMISLNRDPLLLGSECKHSQLSTAAATNADRTGK